MIQEEARHILLFANWLAWHRRSMPLWRRPWFELRVAAVWVFLVWERIGLARGMDDGKPGAGQQLHRHRQRGRQRRRYQHRATLMDICLAENDRRFAGYDPRLLRPTTVPRLVAICTVVPARIACDGAGDHRDAAARPAPDRAGIDFGTLIVIAMTPAGRVYLHRGTTPQLVGAVAGARCSAGLAWLVVELLAVIAGTDSVRRRSRAVRRGRVPNPLRPVVFVRCALLLSLLLAPWTARRRLPSRWSSPALRWRCSLCSDMPARSAVAGAAN